GRLRAARVGCELGLPEAAGNESGGPRGIEDRRGRAEGEKTGRHLQIFPGPIARAARHFRDVARDGVGLFSGPQTGGIVSASALYSQQGGTCAAGAGGIGETAGRSRGTDPPSGGSERGDQGNQKPAGGQDEVR